MTYAPGVVHVDMSEGKRGVRAYVRSDVRAYVRAYVEVYGRVREILLTSS